MATTQIMRMIGYLGSSDHDRDAYLAGLFLSKWIVPIEIMNGFLMGSTPILWE